jgi:hypothetical protein
MFFTLTLPASVKTALTRPSMLSFTIDVIQMPPPQPKPRPGRDIDTISIETLTVMDHVANVDSNPKQHLRHGVRVERSHAILDGHGAFDRSHRTSKLREYSVSGQRPPKSSMIGKIASRTMFSLRTVLSSSALTSAL